VRAIVEVRFGPLAGKKAVIEPGGRLRVGRTERADLVVAHDRQMSAVHFELAWDGARCILRDPGSLSGTSLGGEPVRPGGADHEVPHGTWIKAGETVVMVYHEEKTPPRMGADVAMTAVKQRAVEQLSAEVDALYAVLDASRGPRVRELMRESVEEYRSLYEGIEAESLAGVAPYLVRLPPGARLLSRLVRDGWGQRWGIYLTHRGSFKEVRRHLRRFLMVENEATGKRMYFRYYDPVVLRGFLPTCGLRQREDFYREVTCFVAEGDHGEVIRLPREGAVCQS